MDLVSVLEVVESSEGFGGASYSSSRNVIIVRMIIPYPLSIDERGVVKSSSDPCCS
jgi:hypothetical protein